MSTENQPAAELSPSRDFPQNPLQTIALHAITSFAATLKETVPYLAEQMRLETIRQPYSWGRYFIAASYMAPTAVSGVLLANAGVHYADALKETTTMAENVWWGELVPVSGLVAANITAMFASLRLGKSDGFLEKAIRSYRTLKHEEGNPAWFFNKDLRWIDAGELDWGNYR